MRFARGYSWLALPFSLLVFLLAAGAPGVAGAAECGDSAGPGGTDVPCSCGDRVITDTTLDATDPVTTTICSDDGLRVRRNVHLDLGGNTIRGEGFGVGLFVQGNNTSLAQGVVIGFSSGIETDITVQRVTVTSVVVQRSRCNGIAIFGNRNTVQGSRVEASGRFSGCWGLRVEGDDNAVSNNVVLRGESGGIRITGQAAVVRQNRSEYNKGEGYSIQGSVHTLTLNHATQNGGDGFDVSATGILFERNRTAYNGLFGIVDSTGGGGNTYAGNRCTGDGSGPSLPPGLCK